MTSHMRRTTPSLTARILGLGAHNNEKSSSIVNFLLLSEKLINPLPQKIKIAQINVRQQVLFASASKTKISMIREALHTGGSV